MCLSDINILIFQDIKSTKTKRENKEKNGCYIRKELMFDQKKKKRKEGFNKWAWAHNVSSTSGLAAIDGCILLPKLVFDLSLVYSGLFITKTGVLSGEKNSCERRNLVSAARS